MLDELEIQVCSMALQDNHLIALKRHDLLLDRIYKVYSLYIPCIYYAYIGHLLASLVAHPRLEASDRDFRLNPSELLSFGHREAAHVRLGQSKVPQPGVDLVNMAAPPRGWVSTIGTAALKSVLLLAAVFMWNS